MTRGTLLTTAAATTASLLLTACSGEAGDGDRPVAPSGAGSGPVETSAATGAGATTGSPDLAGVTTAAPPTDAPADSAPSTDAGVEQRAEVRWHAQGVRPVSGAVLVEETLVLYTLADDGGLAITGLDQEDGEPLWSHPATPSLTVRGVGLTVEAVDGRVVHLEPDVTSDGDGVARVVVRDPGTGEVTLRAQTVSTHSRLPGPCPGAEEQVCVWPRAIDGDPSGISLLLDDGWPGTFQQDVGATGYDDPIGPLGLFRATGQQIGRVVDGSLLWATSTADVVGPDASTNSGWHFQALADDELLVGTVGMADSFAPGDRLELTDYALFALDAQTGERRWIVDATDIRCDAWLGADPDPLLACRYRAGVVDTGTPQQDPVLLEGLEVELVRVDPETGETLWRADVTAAGPVEHEGLLSSTALDEHHVRILDTVVDVRDGSARPAADADRLAWADDSSSTEITVPGLRDGTVWGNGRVELPAGVDLSSAPPAWPLPPGVGVELDDGSRAVTHGGGVARIAPPPEDRR